jgi:hypothetical protein
LQRRRAFARPARAGDEARRASAAAFFLAACQQEPDRVPVDHGARPAPNLNAGLSTEAVLAGAARVEVQGYPDRPRFSVLARTPAIEKYPCATCHTVPLEKMRGPAGAPRRAHWGVTLKHAPPAVMSCATCHTRDEPHTLRSLGCSQVGFDHSYQVCAQCHSRQASDWASGAHGKRAGGWAPPRWSCLRAVPQPASAAVDTRWPAVAGRQE